jgi:hypothetical protein
MQVDGNPFLSTIANMLRVLNSLQSNYMLRFMLLLLL